MRKPSLKELEKDYKRFVLQLRNGNKAVICEDDGWLNVYEISELSTLVPRGASSIRFLYDDHCTEFEITHIYKAENDVDYLNSLFFDKVVWDWELNAVEEMTMEEVCKALGKTIKIVKEK